jgi:hypothetical protein
MDHSCLESRWKVEQEPRRIENAAMVKTIRVPVRSGKEEYES